jgi:prephenate dehydrogenase
MKSVLILGTGLLGTSAGLALHAAGFTDAIAGWDRDPNQLQIALERGAVTEKVTDPIAAAQQADVILLSGPVFAIIDWMEKLSTILKPCQLVTDVGSTKSQITALATRFFNQSGRAAFLPGHPMAGREVSGAANAEAAIFRNAVWLFTPLADWQREPKAEQLIQDWQTWISAFGCRVLELEAQRHDELCAWVSHLPQFVSTALSALLENQFGTAEDMRAIGGRALREMTRLGASPYSMWRDVAHTNAEAISSALMALEQRLTHIRENLKTPELREEFELANRFRLPPRQSTSTEDK